VEATFGNIWNLQTKECRGIKKS